VGDDDDRRDAVSRADFERALRGVNLAHVELRDLVLQLAARVVTLTERLGGDTEAAVEQALPDTLARLRAADERGVPAVDLDLGEDKYAAAPVDVPCAELMPLCQARCCRLRFALSTADLDEGLIRWDYGQPYLIRQRDDGYCVHNDPETRGCTVHAARPRPCRVYDCRDDKRIWTDFAQRIPAPLDHACFEDPGFDLMERARARSVALWREAAAVRTRR
jgi:Fe-S-cluster containining protein